MNAEIIESDRVPRGHAMLALGLVIVACFLPPVLYVLVLGGSDCVTPEWARRQLQQQPEAFVLVDVRAPETFASAHVAAAVNWPLNDVLQAGPPQQWPATIQGKTPLLLCDVGLAARLAAAHLNSAGARALVVRGGLQEWIHSARHEKATPLDTWRNTSGELPDYLVRPSPLHEQAMAVLAYFFLKPIYTVLSLAVIIVLWTCRSPDLAALRWAMVFFFIGENCCAVNYFVFEERSYVMEYLHGVGMLLAFGFASFAVLDGIDRRVLMLSDPKRNCAAVNLCGRCIKYADVPCGLRRVFCLLLPLLMLFSLLLPAADWHDTTYITQIFGFPYVYGHLHAFQIFENWFCGGAALLLFAISLVVLLARGQAGIPFAKILMAAGLGPLGFGGLRMLLGSAYDRNRVWFLFWEEGTELAAVVAVCVVLWIFHRRLPLWINSFLENEKFWA